MPRLCPRHGVRQGRAPGAMSLSRRHYARPRAPRITRTARWGHRALPPLHPQNSLTIENPKNFVLLYIPLKSSLCLFVLKTSRTRGVRHHYVRDIRPRWLTAAPYRHYPRQLPTRIMRRYFARAVKPRHCPRGLPVPWRPATARGGSPPRYDCGAILEARFAGIGLR